MAKAGYRHIELIGEFWQWSEAERERYMAKMASLGITIDATTGRHPVAVQNSSGRSGNLDFTVIERAGIPAPRIDYVTIIGARFDPKVRCNSVHPAFVEGPMADDLIAHTSDPARARERMLRDVPLGRFGTASEVADLCVYLLSDESAFVTGDEFVLDGGLTAR